MQKLFIILLLIIFSGSACEKTNEMTTSLIGTWEITRSYGGWSGEQHYNAGNGNTLTFKTDGTFIGKVANADTSFTVTGTYEVYEGKPCGTTIDTTLISFSNSDFTNVLSLKNNELGISDSYCIMDGGSNFYRKIR
jgi:hypothetical protein